MAGYELATAYVNLIVGTNSIAKQIGGGFKGAQGIADKAGARSGTAFAKAFKGKDPIDLKDAAAKAAAHVDVASRKVKQAREKEEAATRKVKIEEAKLSELRDSGKAKTSQLLSAEDRLARAKDRAELATQQVKRATEEEAQAKARADRANEQLISSQKRAGDAATKSASKFDGFKNRVKAAFSGNFKEAFKPIEREADKSSKRIEREFDEGGKRSSSAFVNGFKGALGGLITYFSVDSIVSGMKSVMKESGDLEQSIGAIDSVFKNNAKQMHDWSKAASRSVGLSKNEYNELGTLLGAQLKNAGTAMDDLGPQTNNLIGLGADLASMFGGTTREAVESISSALKGERDPIEKYGVTLKQSMIDAKAAELGFKKVGGSFDAQAQAAATVALIMEQTADAQGNFARETDTLAHKQQVAGAQWANLKAKLGDLFLPALTATMGFVTDRALPGFEELIGKLRDFGGWVQKNAFWIKPLTFALVGFSVGLGIYAVSLHAATWATKLATLATAAWGKVLAITPFGWVAMAIGALVGVLTWFFTQTETGKEIWARAWAGIKSAVGVVVDWFKTSVVPAWNTAVSAIGSALSWLWSTIVKPVFGFMGLLIKAWFAVYVKPIFTALVFLWRNVVAPALSWLWTSVIQPVFGFIGTLFKAWWANAKVVFSAYGNFIKTWVSPIIRWLWSGVIQPVFSLIGAMFKMWWAGARIVFAAFGNFIKTWVSPIIRWLWSGVIQPVFSLIGAIIRLWWAGVKIIFNAVISFIRTYLGPVFRWFRDNVVQPVMNGAKNIISSVWHNGIKPVFQTLGNFIKDKVAPAFRTGVDAIKRAWEGIKEAAKAPVKFVVNTVINEGIVQRFNDIAGHFPGAKKMSKLKLPKGFRAGGRVYGPGTETSDSIPAMLSRNEHVVTADEVRGAGGHGVMYRLRRLMAAGKLKDVLPGFASGGTLSDAARWWQKRGARITEFKAWGQRVGRHSKNSLHYVGKAFDANYGPGGENATEKRFFDANMAAFRKEFPKIGVIWRRKNHFNHAHFDTSGGAHVGTGGGGDDGVSLDFFLGPFNKLKDKLGKQFEKFGQFGQLVKGMGSKAIDQPIEWIKANISKVAGFVSDAFEAGAEYVGRGVARGKGMTWAGSKGWPLDGARWKALDFIVGHESSWNPKAKNPRSTASGLGQFINANARHYLGSAPMSKHGVWAQLDAIVRYTKDRFGGLVQAANFWKRNRYYAKGGPVAPSPTLFDDGGLLQRGVQLIEHRKRRPDRVLTDRQWGNVEDLLKVVEKSGEDPRIVIERIDVHANSESEGRAAMRGIYDELRRFERGGKYADAI